MFPEQLKKILNLIKRTGDRVVIFDGAEPDNSYVVMNLDNYEDLSVNIQPVSAKPNLLDKSFLAKNIENSQQIIEELPKKTIKNDNLTEEDLTDKINREISMWKNGQNPENIVTEEMPKKVWQISPKVKDKAQEVE